MKTIKLLTFVCLTFLFSCSSDENNGNSSSFSLQLTDGSYWTYKVNNQGNNSRDSLYVKNDTVINNRTYKKFKTKDLPTGFYSSSLNNNGVRKSNSKLLLSGSLDIGTNQGLPSNIAIDLDDFVIFDSNANEGNTLDTFSGSFQETVNNIPLTINYTLKSRAGTAYTSYISDGDTYDNVKSTIITLNLTVTAVISGFSFTVLNNQEVLNSEQFIAENIGVVHTNTNFSYSINSKLASQIGIPASASQSQEEFLDTYVIQ